MSIDDASELDGVDLVGLRVSCYWDGEDKFYSGVVRDYVKSKYKPYFVSYDDGEQCWEPRKHIQVISKFPRSAKRKSQALPTSSVGSVSPTASISSSTSSSARRKSMAQSSSAAATAAAASAAQRSARDARRARSPLTANFSFTSSTSPNSTAGGNSGRRKSAPHALNRKTSSGSLSKNSDSKANGKRRGSGDSGGSIGVTSNATAKIKVSRGRGRPPKLSRVNSAQSVSSARGRPPKLTRRHSGSISKQTVDTNETASVTSNSSIRSNSSRLKLPRSVNTSNLTRRDSTGTARLAVGQAVKVYWEGDDLWYHGKIKSIRPSGDVMVLYKDNEEAEENANDVVVVGDDDDTADLFDSNISPTAAGHRRRRASLSERTSASSSSSSSPSSSLGKQDTKPKRGVKGGRSKRKAPEVVSQTDKEEHELKGADEGSKQKATSVVAEMNKESEQVVSDIENNKRKATDVSGGNDKQEEQLVVDDDDDDNDVVMSDGLTESAIEVARKKRRARYEATKEAAKESAKAGLASNNQRKKTRSNCGESDGSLSNTLHVKTNTSVADVAVITEEKTEVETKTIPIEEEVNDDGRFRRGPSNLDWTVEVSVNETKDAVGDAHKVIGCVLTYSKAKGYMVLFRCEMDKSKDGEKSNSKSGIYITSDAAVGVIGNEEWGMLWVNDRNKIVFMLRTNKGAGRGQVAEALKHAPEQFTNFLVNERIAPVGMHIQLMGHTRIRPLAVAAMRGHVTTVRSLLKLGADPKRNGSDGNSAIMWACKYGQCGIVRELVAGSSEMGSKLTTSSTSSSTSTTCSEVDRKEEEKEKEAPKKQSKYLVDINAENKSGLTALMIAARAGKADVVRTLVELQAELDIVDKQSEKSALMHACATQQLEVAAVLVSAGASVGAEAQAMSTLVQYAMVTGRRDLARDLWTGMVKGKTKPNGVLWMAVQCNIVEFVTDLLDTGEDPNKSVHGKFPLMEAIEQDNITIVNALLNAGATLSQTVNSEGHSLFAWACGRALSPELVRRLVRAAIAEGSSVDEESSGGDTAQRSVESSSASSTSSVKAEGAATEGNEGVKTEEGNNSNKTNKKRRLCSIGSPSLLQDGLMNAIESNQEETVAEMVRAGVPVNEHHENGWTALMQACFHGKARIAKRLIDAGGAVNHTNVSGQSALMFACVAGHDTVVKVLVDHNVDCNVTDSGGLSPLMWAIRFCRQEVVNTLIAGGADVNRKAVKTK